MPISARWAIRSFAGVAILLPQRSQFSLGPRGDRPGATACVPVPVSWTSRPRDAVIHRHEEPAPPILLRVEPRRVRTPQLVRHIRRDPAAVAPVPTRVLSAPYGGQQPILPHQPQHAVLAHTDPLGSQTGPDLPVAFAQEVALLQPPPPTPRRSASSSVLASSALISARWAIRSFAGVAILLPQRSQFSLGRPRGDRPGATA